MAQSVGKAADTAQFAPPQSVEAEQAILGSVLKDADALHSIVDFFNSEEFFYVPRHKIIFKAIMNLYKQNLPYDITTVSDELNRLDQLAEIGGRAYLIDLIDGVATTSNVDSYARIVEDRFMLRELIRASNKNISESMQREDTVESILDKAEQRIYSIAATRLRKSFISLRELLPQTLEQVDELESRKGSIDGLSTGFPDLDALTAGLHNGNFIVIAGRPSMGKTALALNIAENVATNEKKSVGIFSIEMSADQLALRLLCGRARISQHKLRTGHLRDSDHVNLAIACGPLSEANVFIDDSAFLTTLELRAKARRLKAKEDIALLVIDYIQMMTSAGKPENRQQEMALISRSIKGLSKELNIPVIAVSQLSRMVETRGGDKRPQLSDLRESGAIEQDADVVMFVYRPEFYLSHLEKEDPKLLEVQGKAEILVAKQRNGPTGKVELTFIRDYIRFENLARGFAGGPNPSYGSSDTGPDAPF